MSASLQSSSRDVCLTLFGAGFGSDTYSTIQAGFQLEQALLYVSAVGRVTAYQVTERGMQQSLIVLDGHDVSDDDARVIEGDFWSWLFLHSHHPTDFSFTPTFLRE